MCRAVCMPLSVSMSWCESVCVYVYVSVSVGVCVSLSVCCFYHGNIVPVGQLRHHPVMQIIYLSPLSFFVVAVLLVERSTCMLTTLFTET